MEKMSTGLCNYLLDTGSLKTCFDGAAKLFIYGGAIPATADAALGAAVLLVTVANAGAEVNFDTTAAGGFLAKKPSETWTANGAANGTATFYRYQFTGDTGALSTTNKRIQGTIGTTTLFDMVVASAAVSIGVPFPINYFTQSIVPS